MKLFAILLGALALLAGVAGGMQAYTASATTAPATSSVAVPHHHPSPQVVRPGVVVKWAPCRPPAVRQGHACVTHVTRTVSGPAPPVTASAAPAPARSWAPAPTRPAHPTATPTHDGGQHEDGTNDGGEHEGGTDDGGEHDD